jgi:hypothetical protein
MRPSALEKGATTARPATTTGPWAHVHELQGSPTRRSSEKA